jgi:putative hydrolase of the HAD superfamily
MFLYFDLGNVLLYFDHEIACREMGQIAGVSPDVVRRVMLNRDLLAKIETGALSRKQAYDAFCRATNTRPDPVRLEAAASDIFRLNHSILPVVTKLKDAGYRLGVLSNISESHWKFVCGHFKALFPRAFDVLALSFKLGAMKPDPRIYFRAAELAGVAPSEVFYCDDIPANVEAACAAGFDAVQYTNTATLVSELRKRGVKFNY